jgi:NAD(P)-dependent dehydrogenase (short-subunit alcohol dehydrogenase family)
MARIFITGVARGIGHALVEQALAAGHQVTGSVRTQEDALLLQSEFGPAFTPLVFDVSDFARVADVAATYDELIDILIHNAGIIGPQRQATLDMDFTGLAETLLVNSIAPLAVIQAFLPQVRRSQSGRILVVSSQMGTMSYAKSDKIAYRMSKAAVNKLVQGLATDLKHEGIAVASLHPGWVQTDMGGPGADITPQTSASGILQRALTLDIATTGRFLNYDGTVLPW